MQQSWRHLAADMEQQQRALQHSDSVQHPDSTTVTVMYLAHCASLAGGLLQLWANCCEGKPGVQQQQSKLMDAVRSVACMADVATGIAAI